MNDAVNCGLPFRLVLLDVMMPEMDGFEVAERIRQNPLLEDCALIMLSSAGQTENSFRCQEMGIARYLIKPVRQSDLRKAILQVLSIQGSPGHSAGLSPTQVAEVRSPRRVLLAEDGLVNQQVARELLQSRGHRVVVVNNGREAVEALERDLFDLVLMDVQMPEMGGFEATADIRLKEQTTGNHIHIVAMTAHAMKGDRERCLKAGMDAYLSKPIQSKSLFEVVEGSATADRDDDGASIEPATTNSGTESILDWSAAVDRVAGREDVLRQMVLLFFKEADKLLPALREAIAQRDMVIVRRLAHSIKGSATCFAAPPAVAAATRAEFMGRDENLTDADEAYALLEREIGRLRQVLTNFAPNTTLPAIPGK